MNKFLQVALIVPVLGLTACVAVPPAPNAPSSASLPGRGKSPDQFRADDVECRNYANAQVGGMTPEDAAVQSGVGSAVVGTAIGALAGAAIGGSSHGAAVGAGVGLVAGTAAGAGAANASAYHVQRRYDISYRQCMYAKGHKVPVARRQASPYPREPYYAPPPPPRYR
jgi:hypothetical protein